MKTVLYNLTKVLSLALVMLAFSFEAKAQSYYFSSGFQNLLNIANNLPVVVPNTSFNMPMPSMNSNTIPSSGFTTTNNYNNSTSSGSYNSSSSSSPRRRECRTCSGSGRCNVCNDAGKVLSNYFGGVEVWSNCKRCGGSKRCHACHGDGFLDEGVDY